MEDTRIAIVGRGTILGASLDRILTGEFSHFDFEGDSVGVPVRKTPKEVPHTVRHTGVAKDRRLARKKRAKKLARRR